MNLSIVRKSANSQSSLAGRTRRDGLHLALLAMGAISILFAAVPEMDLLITRFFWSPEWGFALSDNSSLLLLRDTNRALPWLVISLVLILLIVPQRYDVKVRVPAPHKLVFVLIFFALGPGLLVQAIKGIVGRARPRDIVEFGGTGTFSPPWDLSEHCLRNCSFISGEAASAFGLLTLVVLLPLSYRRLYLILMGVVAAGISFNRVIFGAHFFSDVVLAWSLMTVVAILLWRWTRLNASCIDALLLRRKKVLGSTGKT